MDDVKNILIREVVQSDIDAVIELLQLMSEFKPSKSEYLPIWNSFCQQSNVHSLVAVIDNQIVVMQKATTYLLQAISDRSSK